MGCSSPEERLNKYIHSGNTYLEKHEYHNAILQFKNALQINNESIQAWYGLSIAEEQLGNLNNLYLILNKIVELDPYHIDANIRLGMLFIAGNVIDKALYQSNKLLELDPDNANIRAFRALVLLQLSDIQGAINEATIAITKEPGNVNALVVLANERLSNGDAIGAIKYLDEGISRDENNLILRLIKIQALDELNDINGAVAVFNKLIELYPENNVYKYSLANYFAKHEQFGNAERVFDVLVSNHPDDHNIKSEHIRFLVFYKGINYAIMQVIEYLNTSSDNIKLQLLLAELYQADNRNNKAMNIYKNIINDGKDESYVTSAKIKLSEILSSNGDNKGAKLLLEKVLKTNPQNSDALFVKASIELSENNSNQAIIILRTLLNQNPESVNALALLARAHISNNSFELANEYYRKVLQIRPINETVALEYISVLIQRNELALADDALQTVLNSYPKSISALKLLAELKLMEGDWLEAHKIADHIDRLGGDKMLIEQIFGLAYKGQKEYEQSIDAFKRAHIASPSRLQPIVALVTTYIKVGKKEQALQFLMSVLESHPSNLYALVLIGQKYALDNDLKNAQIYYKKAIEMNPNEMLGYQQLSRFYINQERYQDALLVIDQGLKVLPHNLPLKLSIARIYEKAGMFKEAIVIYEEIIKDQPGVMLAKNNLASILSENFTDEKNLKRAYELSKDFENSSNPYFRDTLGWVYYKLDEYQKASNIFEGVIETKQGIAIFHYHYGKSLLAEGKIQQAKLQLNKAASLTDDKLTGMNDLYKTLQDL